MCTTNSLNVGVVYDDAQWAQNSSFNIDVENYIILLYNNERI